jgi:hypothetical protein
MARSMTTPMSSRFAFVAAGALALLLAACGERPQVIEYKQGTYQGKPDQLPSAGAPWNGNKTEWESAVKNRNQAQNEYKRTN